MYERRWLKRVQTTSFLLWHIRKECQLLKPKLSFRQSASGQPFHVYAREVLLRDLAVFFFRCSVGASETVLMIRPYEVREVIGTGGMADRKSAYPHQTEGLSMDVRILFLTAQPPLPLVPFVPC